MASKKVTLVNLERLSGVLLLISCLLLGACENVGGSLPVSDVPEPALERTGETDVEVVRTDRPGWGTVGHWRLSESPKLAIGEDAEDPRSLLSEIIMPFVYFGYVPGVGSTRGPFRLPSGKIAVGERRSAEVLFFDASGRFVHTAIGEGQGPSELGRLSGLNHCVRGRLTAFDRGLNLAVNVDGDGTFQDRFFLGAKAGRDPYLYLPVTCNRSGQILGAWGRRDAPLEDKDFVVYRPPVHVRLLDSEGYVTVDLGEFAGVERFDYRMPEGRGGVIRSVYPLGKRTALALGADRAFIGTADSFEIEVWSLDGVRRARWRRPTGELTPREEDIVSYGSVEAEFARNLQEARRVFPAFPMPGTYPAYTRFLLDATEHLWIEHFRTPREPSHVWSVFAPDGVWLGEVEVPPRFEITEIGDDYVLGVQRSEFGEQSVRMYALYRE